MDSVSVWPIEGPLDFFFYRGPLLYGLGKIFQESISVYLCYHVKKYFIFAS